MPYGMRGHVGIARETAWGTGVAAVDYLEALSESLITTIDRFDVRNIVGRFTEGDDMDGVRRHAGDLVFPAHPTIAGHFLRGVLGQQSLTILNSSYFRYNWGFLTADTGSLHPLPSFTLEVFRPGANVVNSAFRYAGVQVGSVEMSVAPNQDVRMTARLIARSRSIITATTPTFPASPVNFFAFDTASLSIAGAAVDRIESFRLNLDNQIEGVPNLNNDTEISRVRRTGPAIARVSGTVGFDSFADFDDFRQQTERQVIATFTRANSFLLSVDLPRAVFDAFPIQLAGRGRVTVDFSMIGRYHVGSLHSVLATMTTTNTF